MNTIGLSGLATSVSFKQREFPGLSKRQYNIAQGFDAAACLAGPQGIIAAAAEERFTREKATGAFPLNAIRYCLAAGNLQPRQVEAVAHGFAYEPWKSLWETDDYGRRAYQEVYSPEVIRRFLKEHFGDAGWHEKLTPVPHHLAHAASAFYPSGFDQALVVISDGMGETQSLTVAQGDGGDLRVLKEVSAFHSLGTLYGVITLYLGFYMNSDEYKVMGLAPYGNPRRFFKSLMEFVRLKEDGTCTLPVFAHNHTLEERETHAGMLRHLRALFGPEREPEADLTQDHKDLAAALQAVLETCQLHVLRHFRDQTGQRNLCLAGGVALNCAANGAIRRSGLFERMFVQPAAGDDGTALGAALYVQRQDPGWRPRPITLPLWGPEYTDKDITKALAAREDCRLVEIVPERGRDDASDGGVGTLLLREQAFESVSRELAARLAQGQIVAWFQGRMEFGPRALGSRSILADPRDPGMRDKINALVKKREGFRPFAPVVTREAAARIFEIAPGEEDTYAHMLYVTRVRPEYREKLPATTHVDGSARVQTVSREGNPRLWQLLKEFEKLTGLPVLLNTSFNVRGQPIVCTPQEAIDTFRTANLDVLAAGNHIIVPSRLADAAPPQALAQWNHNHAAPPPGCVHEFFEAQARKTPEATALVFEEEQMTYAELDRRANQAANYLKKLGVGPEKLVGICLEVSLDLVVAMLGVLKAGGAYVPLDPDYPRERLKYMVQDARLPVIVTQQKFVELFADPRAEEVASCKLQVAGFREVPLPDSQLATWNLQPAAWGEGSLASAALNGNGANRKAVVVCLDTEGNEIAKESTQKADSKVRPENLAYVIYTSGSTGKPKGVMVAHRNVANFFIGMDARLGAELPGVWMAVTSISFDISVLELFWTLARGFKVVLARRDLLAGPPRRVRHPSATKPVDFSLFYFASDESAPGADKYRLLLEGARFADAHGFAAVWTPERHFHAFGGLYPNPAITSAAIAAITRQIQIRAGSVVLPLHNPIRVAEEWAVVDNLSHGRTGISVASGWQVNDFVLAPENYLRRKEIMVGQIQMLRRLWRGETVLIPGAEGDPVPVRILPRPVQAELPLWLTASGNPETFRLAGELGANLLTHLLGQSLKELAPKIALYRTAWQDMGHPGQGHVALMLHTFVAQSRQEAKAVVRQPLLNYLRSSIDLLKNRPLAFSAFKQTAEPVAELRDQGPVNFTSDELELISDHAFERYFETGGLFGTPEDCLRRVDQARSIGVDELACLIDFGIETDTVLTGLEQLDHVRRRANSVAGGDSRGYSLAAQMARHGVTHLQCTPSLAALLSEDASSLAALRSLKKVLLGGEALPPSLLRKLDLPGEVFNMYGPTETTIWSTCCLLDTSRPSIPIGRPIANTEIYIVDEAMQPVPGGETGELLIGGAGVVRGYLNRPELTAEKFISNPFGAGRLYRTGDLARYMQDGNLEFLGRIDQQVKLRGHRIELGEIEAVLEHHPDVTQCATQVREDVPGDQRLVAYFVPVPGKTLSAGTLRQWAQRSLPESMVPSSFVQLSALPLTPNGKLDRKSLPKPDTAMLAGLARSTPAIAPDSPAGEQIAQIWRGVLGLPAAAPHDNFFELGGNSILATQLVSRLRAALRWEVPLRLAFEFPVLQELTDALVRHAPAADATSPSHRRIAPRKDRGQFPLSFAQERLWFLHQLESGPHYNDLFNLRLSGPLSPAALEKALNEILQRHESLRAVFGTNEGRPVQSILPDAKMPLPLLDLSQVAAAAREEAIGKLAMDAASRPFHLDQGPLVRALLLRVSPEDHILLLTFHHIVVDGWSRGVLLRELTALYAAFLEGRPSPLPELPIQYADYAAWQRQNWLEHQEGPERLAYWKTQLRSAPALLELPADRPRPAVQTYRGARVPLSVEAALFEQLAALGRREGCTPFMVLLAAFQALLGRYSGRTDILVGTPVANRSPAETEPLIGHFLNLIVLRGDLSGDIPFKDFLARVRETALAAYAHQDLPFEKLVAELQPARALGHSPVFQVMFIMQNTLPADTSTAGLRFRTFEVDPGIAKVDLTLNLEPSADGCAGWLEYATDLFDAARIERLAADFQALLEAIAARPNDRLSQLPLATTVPPLLPPLEINSSRNPGTITAGAAQVFPPRSGLAAADITTVSRTGELPSADLEAFSAGRARNGNGAGVAGSLEANDHGRNLSHVLPRTPVEIKLTEIWSEVLGKEDIGLHDSLFDLGGHSLLITMILSRIRKAFTLEMPIQTLFESPTVAATAQWVEGRLNGKLSVPAPL